MGMKYIIVTTMGLEVPIVFSELLNHNEVAGRQHVVAAGFCNIGDRGEDEATWACWGKSTTLGIESRGDIDAKLLNRMSTNY